MADHEVLGAHHGDARGTSSPASPRPDVSMSRVEVLLRLTLVRAEFLRIAEASEDQMLGRLASYCVRLLSSAG
jgi:hypothetical protein